MVVDLSAATPAPGARRRQKFGSIDLTADSTADEPVVRSDDLARAQAASERQGEV